MHLDIESDDIPAEVARLEKLGAKRVAEVRTWVVMEAPTGHRFCVIRAQTTDFDGQGQDLGGRRVIYREAGDFKTSYAADGQTFPIAFDRWRYCAVLAVAFLVVPLGHRRPTGRTRCCCRS